MAYSTIDKSTDYFNTNLYTGNGSTQHSITGVGFKPDWVWIKSRDDAYNHFLFDAVRGVGKQIYSNTTGAEATNMNNLYSFNADGFSLAQSGNDDVTNKNNSNFVSWNWLAGGTAPSQTYTVKVVSDSGNKYRFDDFGTSAVTLDLQEGGTYTFDQSDSSNSGHPLRFYTASDKSGGEYTTGVTTNGTPGSSGAYTRITVAASAPTLYYQCSSHAGMGGQANTNSTFGSSNFSGSIQSTVSANTTAGFSIVKYTASGSNATIGHGLGVAPAWIIVKGRTTDNNWRVGHNGLTSWAYRINLEGTAAESSQANVWNSTAPTSSVFSIGTSSSVNDDSGGGVEHIAYCFAEKKGYSKFGSYTGNNKADGPFVYLGFRPAWLLVKDRGSGQHWHVIDNKRETFNDGDAAHLSPNSNDSEATVKSNRGTANIDFLSNGFKINRDGSLLNGTGQFIYMAFAESPFVNSNGVPVNAR